MFIVASRARMKDLLGLEMNGLTVGGYEALVYGSGIDAVAAHETLHIVAGKAWGAPKSLWINEGLAVYADDGWWGLPPHALAKSFRAHGVLIPLKNLVKDGWAGKYSDIVAYPELGSFTKYVYETYGQDAVRMLWQRGDKGSRPATGKKLADLEREWLTAIENTDDTSIQEQLRDHKEYFELFGR